MAAPKTANILITIGGTDIICKHENFSSLEIERSAKDVCDKFILKVLDSTAFDIEKILLSKREGNNRIYIEYIDEDLEVDKRLTGSIISLSSSFINNRNMLSLSGYVSTSINDKFEKYSVSWNVVPKFDMADALGSAASTAVNANFHYDGGLDQFWQTLQSFFRQSAGGWEALFKSIAGQDVNIQDYQQYIDEIFNKNLIYLDSTGTYYIRKYDMGKSSDSKISQSKGLSKAIGSYIIPIDPSKLIKLICCGGDFSDLLLSNYIDYKYLGDNKTEGNESAFYTEDISEAEWYFIKKWFEKMGHFDGLGYTKFNCDITTDLIEEPFVQTRESFLDFIYNKVLTKCVSTKDSKKYTNFYLEFENEKIVSFKRLDASKQYTSGQVPNYTYYGKFETSSKNQGRMIAFNPVLDILTAQIAGGTNNTNADISNLSLIGYSGSSSDTKNEVQTVYKEISENEVAEGRYAVKWGAVKLVNNLGSTPSKVDSEIEIAKIFNEVSNLAYKASATIEGFNKLKPMDTIEITIVPKNDTGEPTSHHTSGMYYILSMKDTIEDGRYVSNLELIKNIRNMGNTATQEVDFNDAIGELSMNVVNNDKTIMGSSSSIMENNVATIQGKSISF